ncbi:hypothetical protein BN903_40 [Halorubrum sp. AJ67]|nr:hypothetical protein BN903_40 [Halorubrum sp. AJ67]
MDRTVAIRLTDRLADRVAAVPRHDDELVDDFAGGLEHLFEQRAVPDRQERFRSAVRQRSHPGPAAGREHDSVHVRHRRRAGV